MCKSLLLTVTLLCLSAISIACQPHGYPRHHGGRGHMPAGLGHHPPAFRSGIRPASHAGHLPHSHSPASHHPGGGFGHGSYRHGLMGSLHTSMAMGRSDDMARAAGVHRTIHHKHHRPTGGGHRHTVHHHTHKPTSTSSKQRHTTHTHHHSKPLGTSSTTFSGSSSGASFTSADIHLLIDLIRSIRYDYYFYAGTIIFINCGFAYYALLNYFDSVNEEENKDWEGLFLTLLTLNFVLILDFSVMHYY